MSVRASGPRQNRPRRRPRNHPLLSLRAFVVILVASAAGSVVFGASRDVGASVTTGITVALGLHALIET
jgi:hypothetical protein